jgi:hypothetical protein
MGAAVLGDETELASAGSRIDQWEADLVGQVRTAAAETVGVYSQTGKAVIASFAARLPPVRPVDAGDAIRPRDGGDDGAG